jgi:iron complex outermembrane receptor protein
MYYLNNLVSHNDNEWIGSDGLPTWTDSCTYRPAGQCGDTKYLLYSDTKKRTAAVSVFAEATYPVTDALRLTGGLRYDYTKVVNRQFYYAEGHAACLGDVSMNVNLGANASVGSCQLMPDSGIRRFFNTTWKVRAEYDVTPENMLYATVSTGASPGDIALSTGATSVNILALDSQTLTSYDVGTKNRFMDNKLQLNADFYFQDYGGYQEANVLTKTSPLAFTSVITPVKFYGFDAEALYQLTTKDRLGVNVAYTHGSYVGQNDYLYSNAAGQPQKLKDYIYFKTVYGIPPWTVNANYDHTFDLSGGSKIALHGDVKYTTGYYPGRLSTADYNAGVAPYAHVSDEYVVNTNLMWTSAGGKLSLNGYVRNLFDNRYKTGGGCSGGGPGGASNCNNPASPPTASINSPRSYGIQANVSF